MITLNFEGMIIISDQETYQKGIDNFHEDFCLFRGGNRDYKKPAVFEEKYLTRGR